MSTATDLEADKLAHRAARMFRRPSDPAIQQSDMHATALHAVVTGMARNDKPKTEQRLLQAAMWRIADLVKQVTFHRNLTDVPPTFVSMDYAEDVPGSNDDPGQAIQARELHDVLNAELDRLSNQTMAKTIRMVFFDGVSQADAARAMGVNRATIHYRIAKGLEELRKHMEGKAMTEQRSTAQLKIKQRVNRGELTVIDALSILSNIPGGRYTSTWRWLQHKKDTSRA